ncbi:MAG: CARDB domain-containing protein, partial [Methanobacteriota archaeon]
VDFKVMNVSYGSAGPGETVRVNVALKNVGKAKAEDATVSLSLSSPFVPVDTTERYVGPVGGGEIIQASFDVAIGWDAEIKPYSIPLKISYKVGGTSYNLTKDIGIDVTGKVILEIINVDTSRGLQIDVANIGTRTAEGVKAILTPADGGNFTQRNMTQSQQAGSPAGARPQQAANPMRMFAGGGGWQSRRTGILYFRHRSFGNSRGERTAH